MQTKKRFFSSHQKSSALVVSVILHVIFIAVAISFVAVSVIIKEDQVFETKEVKRPNMKLRKLQVPVKDQKKSQAPKLRKTIVAKPKTPTVDIKLPEIVGVKGGVGYGSGGGLGGLGFGFDLDLFGGGSGTGNEFVGTFYDLKQTPEGEPTEIGKLAEKDPFNRGHQLAACKVIGHFVSSKYKSNRLKDYFKAPKLKYATAFMMPPMPASAAPQAFSVEDQVKGSYWVCHYKGQIAAPENGRYRFCGIGDDILIVSVNGRVVLDASWPELIGQVTSWKSPDDNSRLFSMNSYKYGSSSDFKRFFDLMESAGGYDGDDGTFGNAHNSLPAEGRPTYMSAASRLVLGDWVPLRKGQRVDVDILIGEIPGGEFQARLLIEQDGQDYQEVDSDAGRRKVLPVFKTAQINDKLISQMQIDQKEMTLDGPVFGVLENTTP